MDRDLVFYSQKKENILCDYLDVIHYIPYLNGALNESGIKVVHTEKMNNVGCILHFKSKYMNLNDYKALILFNKTRSKKNYLKIINGLNLNILCLHNSPNSKFLKKYKIKKQFYNSIMTINLNVKTNANSNIFYTLACKHLKDRKLDKLNKLLKIHKNLNSNEIVNNIVCYKMLPENIKNELKTNNSKIRSVLHLYKLFNTAFNNLKKASIKDFRKTNIVTLDKLILAEYIYMLHNSKEGKTFDITKKINILIKDSGLNEYKVNNLVKSL